MIVFMKGWILFFRRGDQLLEEDYSVRRLVQAAEKAGIELEVLVPTQFELVVSRTDERSILIDGVRRELPDFVMSRMGSKTTYFALAILRQLEYLGVPSVNTSIAIEHVKDKLYASQALAQSGLPTPKTMLIRPPLDAEIVEKAIGFPAVVKSLSGTGGRGVYLCDTADTFSDIMDLIYGSNESANIIVQEFVKASHGRDVRVFVVGGRIVGAMQRISKKGFKANVSLGGEVEPFEVNKELELLTIEVCKLFNLDIAGIDFLITESGFSICEANSAPGFIGMERVMGPVIAEEIMDFLKIRFGCERCVVF